MWSSFSRKLFNPFTFCVAKRFSSDISSINVHEIYHGSFLIFSQHMWSKAPWLDSDWSKLPYQSYPASSPKIIFHCKFTFFQNITVMVSLLQSKQLPLILHHTFTILHSVMPLILHHNFTILNSTMCFIFFNIIHHPAQNQAFLSLISSPETQLE